MEHIKCLDRVLRLLLRLLYEKQLFYTKDDKLLSELIIYPRGVSVWLNGSLYTPGVRKQLALWCVCKRDFSNHSMFQVSTVSITVQLLDRGVR